MNYDNKNIYGKDVKIQGNENLENKEQVDISNAAHVCISPDEEQESKNLENKNQEIEELKKEVAYLKLKEQQRIEDERASKEEKEKKVEEKKKFSEKDMFKLTISFILFILTIMFPAIGMITLIAITILLVTMERKNGWIYALIVIFLIMDIAAICAFIYGFMGGLNNK